MTIKIQECWNGRCTIYRMKLPGGGHETIVSDKWNRKSAHKALNVLEQVYHLKRRNVRFEIT